MLCALCAGQSHAMDAVCSVRVNPTLPRIGPPPGCDSAPLLRCRSQPSAVARAVARARSVHCVCSSLFLRPRGAPRGALSFWVYPVRAHVQSAPQRFYTACSTARALAPFPRGALVMPNALSGTHVSAATLRYTRRTRSAGCVGVCPRRACAQGAGAGGAQGSARRAFLCARSRVAYRSSVSCRGKLVFHAVIHALLLF